MSTETAKSSEEVQSRSSADINKEISDLGEMEAKTVAELETKRANLSGVDFDELIIAEATGDAEAKATLVEYDATNRDAQRMQDLIDAIHKQLPKLRGEQKRAELIESMKTEKQLGKLNEPVEQTIQEHLREAARLLDEEWIPREKERYSMRVRWGGGGRTPKQMAFDWVRGYFGALLHPHLDMPPKTFSKEKE